MRLMNLDAEKVGPVEVGQARDVMITRRTREDVNYNLLERNSAMSSTVLSPCSIPSNREAWWRTS